MLQNQPEFRDAPKQFRPPEFGEVIEHQNRLYRIGQQIGTGAFGAVFECTDEWANSLVAKVLLPLSRRYEEVAAEWVRELNNLVALRHPNVTYIFDAFERKDTFYLIMERCESTLAMLLQTPNFDGDRWLPYVAGDILQALDFIHANGYVHKDLHLGNVFVAYVRDKMVPQKQPVFQFKIGDLGISRLESDIDIFNTVMAQWMLPPEFLDPLAFGPLGRQVDIYHVGLLLLRMLLTAEPGYTTDDIVKGTPRQTAERLQSPYAAAIAKALRRHVSCRTQTPVEFWRDIVAAS